MKLRRIRFKRNFYLLCSTLLLMFLLAACGGGQPSDDSASGSMRFNVVYHDANSHQTSREAELDCAGEGIATIEISIYDQSGNFLTRGGPWSCEDAQGTVTGVPAGNSRSVVVLGKSSDGDVVMRGDKPEINVTAGQTSDAGTIACFPFVPALSSPAEKATVEADYINLGWTAVTGAASYDVVASENSDLSEPVISANTTGTTYTPSGLSNARTYYWQVTARDAQGNPGNGSEIRSFDAKAWLSAAAGVVHTVAVTPGGTLWAWGHNYSGQLGLDDTDDRTDPTQVGTDTDWAMAAVGSEFTVAIKNNGTLWSWGHNGYGQLGLDDYEIRYRPTQVGTDTDWAAVYAGADHVVALKTDGTLWSWGDNHHGQLGLGDEGASTEPSPVQVGPDSDWASAAAGVDHTLAVKTNGELWAWGSDSYGKLGRVVDTDHPGNRPIQVGSDSDWDSVSAGDNHSVAVKTTGSLWTWGANNGGQLGHGDHDNRDAPEQVGTDTDWASVAAGVAHSLAVKTNGTVWACGNNRYGQLGNGRTDSQSSLVQVGTDSDWDLVFTGSSHNIALKRSGELFVWGKNSYGQLGIGTIGCKSSPSRVGADTNWAAVSAGYDHTIALKTNSQLWGSGNNTQNQLGDGTNDPCNTITPIGTHSNWTSAAAGAVHTVAVKTDGSLWAWGGNSAGQLGLGDSGYETMRSSPTRVGTGRDWASVAAGSSHTLAVKTNGTLWAWGANTYGQLGLGDSEYGTARSSPAQVGTSTDWASVAAGSGHTLAVKINGTLWAWGHNYEGQLGLGDDGNGTDRSTPAQVGADTNWASVTAGSSHTVALKNDGSLWSWGNNSHGQLGQGPGSPLRRNTPYQVDYAIAFTSIDAGVFHTAAISNGQLLTWGWNQLGQLGLGDSVSRWSPTRVGINSEWETVDLGDYFTLAVKADGTLWAWGDNMSGQLGDGTAWQDRPVHIE